MSKFLNSLSLIALLAIGSAAAAQTATTETATETPAAEETAPAADAATAETAPAEAGPKMVNGVLALGEDISAAEIGTAYTKEQSGDWLLQCVRSEDDTDPCQLYQLLKDGDDNSVAEISLFRLPKGGEAVAGATVIVPLETLLTAQLTIAVDGGKGKRYPFSFCNPIGCYARIGLTESDIAGFRKGAKATVSIVPFAAPDQEVNLNLSLDGFTKGYEGTSEFNPG